MKNAADALLTVTLLFIAVFGIPLLLVKLTIYAVLGIFGKELPFWPVFAALFVLSVIFSWPSSK